MERVSGSPLRTEVIVAEIDHILRWFAVFAPQFLMAVLCGLILGYERQRYGGSIGMLTCVLVCVGATHICRAGI